MKLSPRETAAVGPLALAGPAANRVTTSAATASKRGFRCMSNFVAGATCVACRYRAGGIQRYPGSYVGGWALFLDGDLSPPLRLLRASPGRGARHAWSSASGQARAGHRRRGTGRRCGGRWALGAAGHRQGQGSAWPEAALARERSGGGTALSAVAPAA